MRQYLVTFHKVVPDDSGHDHRALQQQTAVCARTEGAAVRAAQALLCQAAGIVDWRLRADTYEVAELDVEAA